MINRGINYLGALFLLVSIGQSSKLNPVDLDSTYNAVINYPNIEDTWLRATGGYQELNYGGHEGAMAGYQPSALSTYLIRMLNIRDIIGDDKIIISCSLYVYLDSADGLSGDKYVGIKRVFKPWVAGILDGEDPEEGEGCTFSDWSADSFEWGLPGCHNEDDSGIDNTRDGEGADCKETPESIILVNQTYGEPWLTPGYRSLSVSAGLANCWYDESYQNNGLAMKTVDPWGWVYLTQVDTQDETKRPYFVIEYQSRSPEFKIIIDYPNIEDTWLTSTEGCRDLNYGGHGGAIAGHQSPGVPPYGHSYLIRLLNLPEFLGQDKTITSCSLHVYLSNADSLAGDKIVGVKRVFKPWVAGILDGEDPGEGEGCTFNDWSADSYEWGIFGCHNEDDAGVDNIGDGEGTDCKETPESTVLVLQTNEYPWLVPGYRIWPISLELVNGWYDGFYRNNGLVMKTVSPGGWVHPWQVNCFYNYMRPYFVIEYESIVQVTVNPLELPVIIPEEGGRFQFNLSVENTSSALQTVDIWATIQLPSAGLVESLCALNVNFAGLATVERERIQSVPACAPSGTYRYYAFVGDYPWIIDDYHFFTFTKEGFDQDAEIGSTSDWLCTGDNFEASKHNLESSNQNKFSFGNYPNPFNPTTAISYQLSELSHVNLSVYDIAGRKVAELVNGWREAGLHEVTFDASNLPSGIYFARLTAGNYEQTQKLLLLK